MIVRVPKPIMFPNGGWLSTRMAGPHNSRVLVEIQGHSGNSSWCEGVLTFPELAILKESEYRIYLKPWTYEVIIGKDKRDKEIIRFYANANQTNLILVGVHGYLVMEASSSEAKILMQCEGYSRTGANGNRFSFIAAPEGALIAVEPYNSKKGDPIYYRITAEGLEEIGTTDAVISPDEW